MTVARPLQIIATGDSEHDFFDLNKENLSSIIAKIPADCKVAVVSVVGAFRTGKSFLLNFFLRYLRNGAVDQSSSWMVAEGEELTEGNMNEGWSLVDAPSSEEQSSQQQMSFQWRGGKERQTTGIWMWSEPFIRSSTAAGAQKLAVLLMDTQGMFDNETTMTLTAQIFGLSTLVSSFQIYNVDKRIQEDNLQHLALFSEYGRMALDNQHAAGAVAAASGSAGHAGKSGGDAAKAPPSLEEVKAATLPAVIPPPPPPAEADGDALAPTGDEPELSTPPPPPPAASATSAAAAAAAQKSVRKPFQHLQFLVRDWQNFEDDLEEEEEAASASTSAAAAAASTAGDEGEFAGGSTSSSTGSSTGSDAAQPQRHAEHSPKFQKMRAEMQAYLTEVLRERGLGDLQSTREQITRCFDTLDCFMLPHPGFAVTKKNYDGAIRKIEPFFRALVNRYVRLIFDEDLVAKQINGRQLTGRELQTYIEVYVAMFQAGKKSFPKAMTMLDATAEANNRNAYDLSLDAYKKGMDAIAGPDQGYVKEEELQKRHDELYIAAFSSFDEIATMGAPSAIAKVRAQLKAAVEKEKERYYHTNSLRNPFKDAEVYVAALLVAAVSWLIAVIVNASCSTDFCEDTEDTFVNIYLFVIFAAVVFAWRHIRGALLNLKRLLPIIMEGVGQQAAEKMKKN